MATKYKSNLTSTQMQNALHDMDNHISEAWAVGERNGTAVISGDETYHNNAKYYAEQAARVVPTTGTPSVRYDTAQVLTETEQATARNNIGAERKGIASNPNLLDNPFFTVNQRGATSGTTTSASVYPSDRWTAQYCSYAVNSNGTISVTLSDTRYGGLYQVIEVERVGTGNTVTVSALIDGVYGYTTLTTPSTAGTEVTQTLVGTTCSVRFRLNLSGKLFQISIQPNDTSAHTIKAVKLEFGSVSTLANDNAPNYAEELRRCNGSTADTSDGYANYIGAKVLLWENASPTSEFSAQTINLDLSNYRSVEIVNNSNTTVCKVGAETIMQTSSAYTFTRSAKVNATNIIFGACNRYNSYGAYTTTATNTVLIPTHIYGIK